MKIQLLPALFFALTTLGCASTDGGATKASAPPSMEEVMAAMMRAGTPGAQHKALQPFVGTWNAKVTMWMGPAEPATQSVGTMVNSWIYDGRYLEQKYEGEMEGMKFEGTGMWGFDVAAGKYVGTWFDSMSTGVSNSTGTASADGKTFKMQSVMTDPMSGKPASGETVIMLDGPNQHTMSMYEDRGGQMVKTMQIVYTRKQ